MKILITGANGFLGRHLILHLGANPTFEIFATSKGEVKGNLPKNIKYFSADLKDDQVIKNLIVHLNPICIIHTAAMSKPDECETNKVACINNNLLATQNIIRNCEERHLIFTSTDFVFGDGINLKEDEQINPLNYYGQVKAQAESFVSILNNYAILRPVFMYGKQIDDLRPSFIQWVAQQLKKKQLLKLVDDHLRTPTYVIDVCMAIEQMILKKSQGVFHIAGNEITTPYKMGIAIAHQLNLNKDLITAVDASTFEEPAVRAKACTLNCDKAKKSLNFNPRSFENGLKLSL